MTWVQGDALDLPFEDSLFDAATMGYGLRNVADISKALSELRRVLVRGGKVSVLDFNNSSQPLVDTLQVGGQQVQQGLSVRGCGVTWTSCQVELAMDSSSSASQLSN